jgi:cyanophycin synthetase
VKILESRFYEGRNIWSPRPVLQARLFLSPREQVPTSEIPGFNEMLAAQLPGLAKHTCSRGYPGGFLERLREGTYLGHVVEHVALEVQSAAGFPVSFGKTLRGNVPDTWDLIISCRTPGLGAAALETAVDLVAAVLERQPFDVAKALERLEAVGDATCLGPSTESILEACCRRGIPALHLGDGSLYQLGYGCCGRVIQATMTSRTSAIAVDICCDKVQTKRLLAASSLPVPRGSVVTTLPEAQAEALALGYPVAVKPCHGNQGKAVSLNLTNLKEVSAAFRIAQHYDQQVLVEEYVQGRQYRLLVIGNRLTAAAERLPAAVRGDGAHTVRELVGLANQDPRRGEGHARALTRLSIDPAAIMVLARQGYAPDSIPPPGVLVLLRDNANLSAGGAAEDVTALVHPENAYLAVQAALLLGLDVAGIDMVTPDITAPARKTGGRIIEVNAAPGFRMHLFPSRGVPRPVGQALVDYLFPPGCTANIPVISVTGTNGKTTTVRLLGHIFQQQGKSVGMTTTGGIYVNARCICKGDTTGPNSARTVLRDPAVEVAVLETARGGILRAGLGYDLADVAVVTNIAPDHLGQDGIETLEDLFWIKSLVVEAVKKDGHVVLNADDSFAARFTQRARANLVYFSMHGNNLLVRRHLSAGGCAVLVKDGIVYFCRGEEATRIIGLKAIRVGMGGRALHNLENALAATAAACVCGLHPAVIRHGLRTFGTELAHNPGRLMVRRMGRVTVIVDFGHNAPAFRRIVEFARSLKPRRLLGVVGVPGDRGDDQIEAAGEAVGTAFDELFIKEDRDLRGRAPGEIAGLLYNGARQAGLPQVCLHLIHGEAEAAREALRRTQPGDVLVIFYEDLEGVLAVLEAVESSHRPAAGTAAAGAALPAVAEKIAAK